MSRITTNPQNKMARKKTLKWKCEAGELYNYWLCESFEVIQRTTSNFYKLRLSDGTVIHHAFKKLSTAKKVAQLIHNG